MKKAGRGHFAVSAAVDSLTKKNLIEALDAQGNRLETAEDRQRVGGRIYYRFNTFRPPMTIFDTFPKNGKVEDNEGKNGNLSAFQPARKADTTKETLITKDILATENSVAGDNSQKGSNPSGESNTEPLQGEEP